MQTIQAKPKHHFVDFNHESASCTLVVPNDGTPAVLIRVYSQIRRQGHARGLMAKVIEYADTEGLEIRLRVRGYGGPVQTMLSNQELVEFYKKFGFEEVVFWEQDRLVQMQRLPREKNTPYDEREN